MLEFVITLFVILIIVAIFVRYGGFFSLPFFWAAVFAGIYVGLLEIRTELGGSSYLYAALGFGMFFLGLLVADFFSNYLRKTPNKRGKKTPSNARKRESNPKPAEQQEPIKIRLMFPLLPLKVGLFVSLLGATVVTVIFFSQQGIPVLSSFPALAWVQSTSGVVNRLMSVFGPGCYAGLGLVAWAIHRETGSLAAKWLMYLGFGLAILAQSLLASKAAALMIFIWFNILIFYLNKKREFWRTVLPFLLVVVPISTAIVAVRLLSSTGYWQAGNISSTFVNRITIEAAEPLDFVFKYSDRFGPTHGEGLLREVARVKEQLTGGHKRPILTEYVFDLLNGLPQNTTGLSAALTLEGIGYIEWGLYGLLLYSLIQGLVFGWIHTYLLRQKKMSIVSVIFWGAVLGYVMNTSVSGVILIGLESLILGVIPPLALLFPFSFFFLLPIGRKYDTGVPRKISKMSQA